MDQGKQEIPDESYDQTNEPPEPPKWKPIPNILKGSAFEGKIHAATKQREYEESLIHPLTKMPEFFKLVQLAVVKHKRGRLIKDEERNAWEWYNAIRARGYTRKEIAWEIHKEATWRKDLPE